MYQLIELVEIAPRYQAQADRPENQRVRCAVGQRGGIYPRANPALPRPDSDQNCSLLDLNTSRFLPFFTRIGGLIRDASSVH